MISTGIRGIAETYLTRVRNSGSDNITAICPFHTRADGSPERNPSFAMSLTTGLYFCHSCQSKGNLRRFLREVGVSPVLINQTYKYILEETEAAVTPPPNPLRPKVVSTEPIPDQLLGLFNYCPTSLLASGFTEETLQTFEVGFDKWHNRITHPVRDLKGQLVAINARAIYEDQEPRYKIYDEEYKVWDVKPRLGWDKRTVLFNAHRVYPEVYFETQPEPVIVVEGYKAAMWVHQAGLTRVVALMGSYLSWEHRWILERLGAPVHLFLDNNEAGWKGAYKAARVLSNSLHVRIVTYPERLAENEAAQPDDCTPEEILFEHYHAKNWYTFLYS